MLESKLRATAINKPTGDLLGIAYGGGQWVAVGVGGAIWTSSDAKTWKAQSSGTTNDILDVNYTGSLFFACGTTGLILTSTDGVTWTDRSVAISQGFQRCSIANGVFFITGGSATVARLYTSTDGTTWTSRTTPAGMQRTLLDVVYYDDGVNARYYVVGTQIGTQPAYGYSTNLSTWTSAQAGLSSGGNGFTLITNGSIVVMGSDTASTNYVRFSSSTNGTTYTNRYTGTVAAETVRKGIWTGTNFIVVGLVGGLYTSTNGTSWSASTITTEDLRGIRQQGSEILIVGDNGTVGRSVDDGASWSFL